MTTSAPFVPLAGALPDLSQVYGWSGWTSAGSVSINSLAARDVNGDGRDDLVVPFWQVSATGAQTSAPTPSRLVVYIAQPDGSYVDGTESLFGTAIVVPGGMTRKVDVGDINGDGRPDFAYAVNQEDGRSAMDVTTNEAKSTVVLSQPGGLYKLIRFGLPDWHHAVRIFESDGVGHVVVQGFTRSGKAWINGADGFMAQTNEDWVLNAAGTAFVSIGDFPADASTFVVLPAVTPGGEVSQVVSLSRHSNHLIPAMPGLLERDGSGNWALVDALDPLAFVAVPFVSWNNDKSVTNLATVDGHLILIPNYSDSAIVRLDAYTEPLVLFDFSGHALTAPRSDGYYYPSDSVQYHEVQLYRIEDHQLVRSGNMIGLDPFTGYPTLDVLDLNHDGLEDIVTYPYTGDGRPDIHLSLGNGDFKKLDTSTLPLPPEQGWGTTPYLGGSGKFLDANGDGIYDLLYYMFAGPAPGNSADNWTLHLGTTSRLGDLDASPITIESRGHGSIITTWAGNDLIKDADPSAHPTTIDAGLGIDTAQYAGSRAGYTVAAQGGDWTVDKPGAVDDLLVDVERLAFADVHIALDLDAGAGSVAKTLGAVFGAGAVGNPDWVGVGLSLADGGLAYEQLMDLALHLVLGPHPTHEQVVSLLYQNVMGSEPTPAESAPFIAWLDAGFGTPAQLGMLAGDHPLNLQNIDFTGLQAQGLAFSP